MSESLAESFDILLMGDMFFDENLGGKLSNLAKTFKETCPKSKMVLIGDPGRWLLAETQKNKVFQSTFYDSKDLIFNCEFIFVTSKHAQSKRLVSNFK